MTKDHSLRHKHRHRLISEDDTGSDKYLTSPGLDDFNKRKSKHRHKHKSSGYHCENRDPDQNPSKNHVIEVHDSSSEDDAASEQFKKPKHCSNLKSSSCNRKYSKNHKRHPKSRSESSSGEEEREERVHRSQDRHDYYPSRKEDKPKRDVPDVAVDRDKKRKDYEEGSSRNKKMRSDSIKMKQESEPDENGLDVQRVRIKSEPRDSDHESHSRREPVNAKFRIKEEPRDNRSQSQQSHRNDRQGPSGRLVFSVINKFNFNFN